MNAVTSRPHIKTLKSSLSNKSLDKAERAEFLGQLIAERKWQTKFIVVTALPPESEYLEFYLHDLVVIQTTMNASIMSIVSQAQMRELELQDKKYEFAKSIKKAIVDFNILVEFMAEADQMYVLTRDGHVVMQGRQQEVEIFLLTDFEESKRQQRLAQTTV